MFVDEPYFMTNDEWYYFDAQAGMYKLMENVPDEVRKSYEEFYSEPILDDEADY